MLLYPLIKKKGVSYVQLGMIKDIKTYNEHFHMKEEVRRLVGRLEKKGKVTSMKSHVFKRKEKRERELDALDKVMFTGKNARGI